MQVISFWAPNWATQRALWFSSVANINLWFTFAKAIYSVLKGKFLNRRGPALPSSTPDSRLWTAAPYFVSGGTRRGHYVAEPDE